MTRKTKKLVHEGPFAAEVEVELDETNGPWSLYFTLADTELLDQVWVALRNGDVKAAARYGQVFHLNPVEA